MAPCFYLVVKTAQILRYVDQIVDIVAADDVAFFGVEVELSRVGEAKGDG
jgi:hypothetical protein